MAHRKWRETKQEQGTAGPGNMLGSCLISFHFLWAILCPQSVHLLRQRRWKINLQDQVRNLHLMSDLKSLPPLSYISMSILQLVDYRYLQVITVPERNLPITTYSKYLPAASCCTADVCLLYNNKKRAKLVFFPLLQPADIGWPTGNGKKLSNCQACCLPQLCLAAA